MLIDYKDSRPIYEQIVEQYKKLILTGAMVHDERLPSVRNLAMELSANPNTVQRAYTELERQGFLYSVKGRGNFVCNTDFQLKARRDEIIQEIVALIKEAAEIGVDSEELHGLVTQAVQKEGAL